MTATPPGSLPPDPSTVQPFAPSAAPPTPSATPPPRAAFNINDFLTFRYLITPTLVAVIYAIGAILITLGALATLVSPTGNGAIAGILIFVFGNLYWRVALEIFVVLFRINDGIQSIDRRGRGMS